MVQTQHPGGQRDVPFMPSDWGSLSPPCLPEITGLIDWPRAQLWTLTIRNTFTFMHLADAFIQSDLQCIQAIRLSVCAYIHSAPIVLVF